MKKYFEFYTPVQILSGEDIIQNGLGKEAKKIGCTNAIVLSGPVLNKLQITDFVRDCLVEQGVNVACNWTEIPNESSVKTVQKICNVFLQNDCDSIVAVGGGSVLDTAKAVKLCLSQNTQNKESMFGYDMAKSGAKVPFIAIPTTCGTGSESTKVAVICDEQRGTKEEILSEILLPDIAVLDPKMLYTLPKKSILLTAFDALAHAIEGYCGKGKNCFSDEYSKLAISLILQNLECVLGDNPTNEGRLNLLKGATYAGISFSNSMVGAVHAIAHSAGSVLGIGHDFAVASFLLYVLKYNIQSSKKEYAKLFDLLPCDRDKKELDEVQKAENFVCEIKNIFAKYASKIGGIPTLKDCGLNKSNYQEIAKLSLCDGAILTNIKYLGYNDIINILQMAEEDKL